MWVPRPQGAISQAGCVHTGGRAGREAQACGEGHAPVWSAGLRSRPLNAIPFKGNPAWFTPSLEDDRLPGGQFAG
jgi:hypothetical protein